MTRSQNDAPGPADVVTGTLRFPPDRYGRRRDPRRSGRWAVMTAVVVAVLAFVGLSVKLFSDFGETRPASRVLRWSVLSDREIRIEFEVPGTRDAVLQCTVRSRGKDGAEVGRTIVPVPSGKGTVTRTVVLATTARAVTGELESCER